MMVRRATRRLVLLAIAAFAAAPCRGQTLYVYGGDSDSAAGQGVFRVSPAGTVKIFSSPAETCSGGLALDSHGNLFVSTRSYGPSKDQIIKITPDGTASVFADAPNATHMVCDAYDDLYEIEDGTRIFRITPAGKKSFVADVLSGEEGALHGLAVDRRGNVYVSATAPFHDRIVKVSPSGRQHVFAVMPGKEYKIHPNGLAVDARGNLYVASENYVQLTEQGEETGDPAPSRIIKFTSRGKRMTFAIMLDHSNGELENLAFDTHGNLYVTDSRNMIFKIDASGSTLTTLITSIPEPSAVVCQDSVKPKKAAR